MFSFPSVISYTVSMRDNLLLLNLLFLAWIFRMPQLIKSWGIFNVYLPIFFAILNRWLNDKYLLSVYNDSCQRGTAMKYRVSEYLLHLVCWQMTISYLNIWIMSAINLMNKVRQCFEVCGKISNSRKGEEVRVTGAGIPAPGGRRGSVMNPGETETVKENAYRRDVRT